MNKKFISIILLMAIVFADISILNPQNILANDKGYSVEYNQKEISDVYIDDTQQAVSAAYATSKSGSWIKASNGKWWYKHADGSYTKNDWEYIDGYWYHFDSNGYMQISWQEISGKWYHFDANGHMDVGWHKIADYWYYFNSSGVMQISWQKISGNYYHFDAKGRMDTAWKYIGDYWYYFGYDGVMRLSWHEIDGKYYHFDANGHMDIGWHYIGNGWYYFESNGVMRTQSLTQDKRIYEFDSSGLLIATDLMVERQEQEKTKWCWAASSVMVGTYYTDSKKTQTEVVWYVKGFPINEGGISTEEIRGIEFASGFKKEAKAIDLFSSFDSAINEIDNNKPFLMRMMWFGDGGHAVVCVGYKNTDQQKSIRIADPAPNRRNRYYNFSDFKSGVTMESGKGWCEKIITYEYK